MSVSDLKTKYTVVRVDTDLMDDDPNYHGYIAVNFNYKTPEEQFFSNIYDLIILEEVKKLFEGTPNLMIEKEIRFEDGAILIDLPNERTKNMAADVIGLVKRFERKFDEMVE